MPEQKMRDTTSLFELRVPMRAAVLVSTGLILVGLVYLYYETYNMSPSIQEGYPGDAFFPRIALIFSMIWAVIILVRGIFLSQEAAAVGNEEPYVSAHWLEFVSVVVLVLLYALLLERIGFEIMTVVFMMILLVPRLQVMSTPRQALLRGFALSLVTMLILYVALGPVLKIPLPLTFLPIYIL
jgi:hypothetical protein